MYMSPREFLAMAERLRFPDERKAKEVRMVLDEFNDKWNSLPLLTFENQGESAQVVGHEGRHRARAMIENGMGDQPMPVRINQLEGGDVPVIRMFDGNGINGILPEDAKLDMFKDSPIADIMLKPMPMPRVVKLK